MDELGDKFDIKQFHAEVLMIGALPLAILEKKWRYCVEVDALAARNPICINFGNFVGILP